VLEDGRIARDGPAGSAGAVLDVMKAVRS
jgi:hypothetical protein